MQIVFSYLLNYMSRIKSRRSVPKLFRLRPLLEIHFLLLATFVCPFAPSLFSSIFLLLAKSSASHKQAESNHNYSNGEDDDNFDHALSGALSDNELVVENSIDVFSLEGHCKLFCA